MHNDDLSVAVEMTFLQLYNFFTDLYLCHFERCREIIMHNDDLSVAVEMTVYSYIPFLQTYIFVISSDAEKSYA